MGKHKSSSSTMASCFFSCFTSPKSITDVDDSHHHHHHHTIYSNPPPPLPQHHQSKTQQDNDIQRFSWDEIQRYTWNFSQVIGVGGFSTVYLASLNTSSGTGSSSSMAAAVKIYNYSSERLNRVFRNELDICTQLHHPNIVKLLGYCDERDEGVLVFDYIQSGNLQDILHTTPNKNIPLPWKTRMSIAYNLAKSLLYLHEQCSPHIVHGDIKSSNILLSSTSSLKLCDFGSSKLGFSSTITSSSSSSSSSSSTSRTAMIGSPGYVDPHYLMTGIISKKSDIYSFGVIILELITGLEPYSSDQEQLLTSLVRKKNSNCYDSVTLGSFDVDKVVQEMMDSKLKESNSTDENEVRAMACVAAMCLHHMPSLRPTAAEICQVMRENHIVSVELDKVL